MLGLAASILVREYPKKWILDFPRTKETGMLRNDSYLKKNLGGTLADRTGSSSSCLCFRSACFQKGDLMMSEYRLEVFSVLKG